MNELPETDPEVAALINREEMRQNDVLSLIPSENMFSTSVHEAVGSVFSHKYSEGNIGKRYYEGCEIVDELESLAIERAREAFSVSKDWSANVQALSGSSANLAVYLAALQPGDTMMGMYLPDGGHLSHGWSYEKGVRPDPNELVYEGGNRKVHITSKLFKTVQYKTDPKTQLLNYDEVEKIADQYHPKLLITGGTAYPRNIDYERMSAIAKKVGALYLADIAHEAGLIAAGALPSPVGLADFVTLTTHKTLRAGRGSIVLAHKDWIRKINHAVLPGLQGGPHNHNLAGIAVGLREALRPEFKAYAHKVLANAQSLAKFMQAHDFDLVAGGTDKHLILIDLSREELLGKKLAAALARAGIVANYNTMPQEMRPPTDPSALRLGTPWITSRGMGEEEMKKIAHWTRQVLQIASSWKDLDFKDFALQIDNSPELARVANEVKDLCSEFPTQNSVRVRSEVRY